MKKISNIIALISIFLPVIAFVIILQVGELKIFNILGIVRYSWIMLLFIPASIFCGIWGIYLFKTSRNGSFNIFSAVVSMLLLTVWGVIGLFPSDVTYDPNELVKIEERVDFEFPDSIKFAMDSKNNYTVGYVKIRDKEEKEAFENIIKNSQKWTESLGTKIENSLPPNEKNEIYGKDYYLFYNITTGEYNTYPKENGEYDCVFIGYSSELGALSIIDSYRLID